MHNKKTIYNGFTLIELSIVVVILGLMIGGIMSALTQESRRAKKTSLENKMDAIEKAIIAYVKKNNRLPCPADGTYVISSEFFGMEGGTAGAGSCGSGATYDGSGLRTANTTPPNANYILSNTAAGVIPVRSLGLPNDFAFDPWGGRFTFAVDKRFTATNAMSTYAISDSTGAITVNDNSGNAIVTNAITVVLSHGENGHGAFLISGNRKNGGSTNANEQVNCHCNASGTAAALTSVFVAGKNTTTSTSSMLAIYDDVTRYYGRRNFPNSSDTSTESK